MKWIKTKCFYSALLFLGFLSLLSVVSLSTVNDTFAVADIVYTLDSTTNSNMTICSGSDCPSYHYLQVDSTCSDSSTYNHYLQLEFTMNPFGSNITKTLYNGFNLFSKELYVFDSLVGLKFLANGVWTQIPSSCSVVLTLSENNPFGGSTPSGSLSITENGTYDVTNYAEAVVDVPTSSVGDGGTDVSEIVKALYTLGGVILVVYFFYCIYRMIIKPLRS